MATAAPSVADLVASLEAGTTTSPERAAADRRALLALEPELAAVKVEDFPVEGPDGVVPARLYRGPAGSEHALMWMHGGAFLAGDLDMPEADWVGLALAAAGTPVLSVDYRKALGGIRFPAPSDDVLAVWNVAAAGLSAFGETATRLHLGGAGPLPASVVLAYPLVHAELPPLTDELAAAVDRRPEGAIVFGRRWIAELSRHYVGATGSLEDPYAFPANGELGASRRSSFSTRNTTPSGLRVRPTRWRSPGPGCG
jgi:acetyl esterase